MRGTLPAFLICAWMLGGQTTAPTFQTLSKQAEAERDAKQLGKAICQDRGCLLIWGEGGAGKTTLACQLGLWSLAVDPSQRPCDHLMLPVLIEHEALKK